MPLPLPNEAFGGHVNDMGDPIPFPDQAAAGFELQAFTLVVATINSVDPSEKLSGQATKLL
jgi:hypothetical protein